MTTKIAVQLGVGVLCLWFYAASAHAQIRQGTWRGFLDVDAFSVGMVKYVPEGPAENQKFRVLGVGPNQIGGSRAVIGSPPLGFGFSYALRARWLLGLRTGLGFDRVASDDIADIKVFVLSLMPEVTFVPLGKSNKLFARFSPILQYDRLKVGAVETHIFQGCFSIGAGGFLFVTKTSSVDVGANFEGRFGTLKGDLFPDGREVRIKDLRGVIRVGLSFWK